MLMHIAFFLRYFLICVCSLFNKKLTLKLCSGQGGVRERGRGTTCSHMGWVRRPGHLFLLDRSLGSLQSTRATSSVLYLPQTLLAVSTSSRSYRYRQALRCCQNSFRYHIQSCFPRSRRCWKAIRLFVVVAAAVAVAVAVVVRVTTVFLNRDPHFLAVVVLVCHCWWYCRTHCFDGIRTLLQVHL